MTNGAVASAGTCLYASIALKQALEKFADCVVKVRGGDGHGDGGILGRDELLHGHYWLEGRTFSGVGFVADITADQFGYAQVVVLPWQQARAIYYPGVQDVVDCAVKEIERDLIAA